MFRLQSILILFYLGLTSAFIMETFNFLFNQFYSKCDGMFLKNDVRGLRRDLDNFLFGQPLVSDVVVNALNGHLRSNPPSKPLVLSFHGWPGGGKNYVSDFIVKNLFAEGHSSSNYYLFSSKIHFPLKSQVDKYQLILRDTIVKAVWRCKHSIFIFDEAEKYPAGVLDAVKPFLDYKVVIDGVDYRYAIFIFLSNAGGNVISKNTYDLWKKGVNRENFKLRDFENDLKLELYNDPGGFYRSDLIDGHVIDHYIPFLPLEKSHVKLCVQAELDKINHPHDKEIEWEVIQDLTFGPENENLFSTSGCKRISQLIYNYVKEHRWKYEL